MEYKLLIEITEFTDPLCTWCWGSEPILRKLEARYDGNIKINFIMGGLVEDIRGFRDSTNNIGGDISSVNTQIINHWAEASSRYGMPVESKGFKLFSNEHPSSYPMNIAYKAAQFQDEALAKKFLRRMREAAACEAREANKMEVLIELAQEAGLDVSMFISSFSDGSAEKAFHEDLKITKEHRVAGFPSFLIKVDDKAVILRGYQSYETFKSVIDQIAGNKISEKTLEKTESDVLIFINKYEKVAPIEIQTTFNLSDDEMKGIIQSLNNQKIIDIIMAGNGYFIKLVSDPLACNSETGICSI